MVTAPPKPSSNIWFPDWAEPLFYTGDDLLRFIIFYGGRSSGKTQQVARALSLIGHMEPHVIYVVREHLESIKKSAKPAIEHWIRHDGLEGPRAYKITENAITHNVTGTRFEFAGMSKVSEEDIKGWEGVTRTWFEEMHRMSERSRELLYPTVFRQDNSQLIGTFNPQKRSDPCYKDFVSGEWFAHSRYVRKVNYMDNPWFPEAEEELRREWERNDPQDYPHTWLGEPDDADADKTILPYAVLWKCVEAYKQGLAPKDNALLDAGLDLAEGGRDKCACVIRRGPVIEYLDVWPGVAGDLSQAAMRAHEAAERFDVYRLYYDASSPIMTEFRRLEPAYTVRAISFGGEVGGKEVMYERRRENQQVFRSRNIQMADALRLRANRTVQLLNGAEGIDPDQCLFISDKLPNLESFLAELSTPIRRQSPINGKWELDKRGGEENEKSPDSFDATALAFARDSDNGLRAR